MKYSGKNDLKNQNSKTGSSSQNTRLQIDDDFINQIIAEIEEEEKDVYILMKCDVCGYEEDVPTWILGEFNDVAKHLNKPKNVNRVQCPEYKCKGGLAIK